jgi:hypothetical protein
LRLGSRRASAACVVQRPTRALPIAIQTRFRRPVPTMRR